MDTRTGRIFVIDDEVGEVPIKRGRGQTVPIPNGEVDRVGAMNRKERRKWAAKLRHEQRKARKDARRGVFHFSAG